MLLIPTGVSHHSCNAEKNFRSSEIRRKTKVLTDMKLFAAPLRDILHLAHNSRHAKVLEDPAADLKRELSSCQFSLATYQTADTRGTGTTEHSHQSAGFQEAHPDYADPYSKIPCVKNPNGVRQSYWSKKICLLIS